MEEAKKQNVVAVCLSFSFETIVATLKIDLVDSIVIGQTWYYHIDCVIIVNKV